MSRLEEVESTWDQWGCGRTSYEMCELALEQARTIAAEVDELRAKISGLEYRIEHPPLAENQDDLARIAYEAYMGYTSADALAEHPWDATDEWESYGWRLAANAVRLAVEGEVVELQRRLDAVVKMLERREEEEDDGYCKIENCSCEDAWRYAWYLSDRKKHARAVAIAEGRNNG